GGRRGRGGAGGGAAEARGEEVARVRGRGGARGRRRLGPVEPVLAVAPRGDDPLAHERAVGSRRDRYVRTAGELEHAQGVGRRLVERLVAGHRRHAVELGLGRGKRNKQRDGVVVPGVAIEDQSSHSPTWSAVGRADCAPTVAAAHAPATHATWSARSREAPCSSITTSAAVNASPAPVASCATIVGGVARATSLPPSKRAAPSLP